MPVYLIKDQNNNDIKVFRITNKNGFSVDVCEFGASILRFTYPDKTDVVVGPKYSIDTENWHHYGSICGRVAGRIRNGIFSIDKVAHKLDLNQNHLHHLHGGYEGFSKKFWTGKIIFEAFEETIELRYVSKHKEGGYPSKLHVKALYTLNNANELILRTEALPENTTIVNLSNHVYWNLNGVPYKQGDKLDTILSGLTKISNHDLEINSESYYETDPDDTLPTGKILPVKTSPLDFTYLANVGGGMNHPLCIPYKGYDHVFALRNSEAKTVTNNNCQFAARLVTQNRKMDISTSCPALVLYTGNNLPIPHTAICLETQFPPDAPNFEHFHSIQITPHYHWQQTTIWRFF